VNLSDCPKNIQDQAQQAAEMCQRQADALAAIEAPIRKLARLGAWDKLNRREQRTLLEHLRWGEEDVEAFLNPQPAETQLLDGTTQTIEPLDTSERIKRTLATPRAHFYFEKGGLTYRVDVVQDGADKQKTTIIDENDPDFE
jgi:hypothetical protein